MKNTNTRKLILSMTATLDGFVSGPNNDMSWLVGGDDLWAEMFKDLESVDTFLMGAGMSQEYASYWNALLSQPDADPNLLKFAKLDNQTQHVVISKTIKKIDYPNYRIATDVESEITKLKQQPGKNIFTWGGASFANSLIRNGLIDELRITISPILLGDGKALFQNVNKQKWELINTRPLKSGGVLLNYRPVN